MRFSKIILIVLVLCLASALSIGCASKSETATVTEDQVVTVQRGNMTIDVTSSGNLSFSHEEELAFEVDGTVGEVLVGFGDHVEEGQVLAKLDDISELDIAQAEADVANAKVALKDAQEALEEAENPYTETDIARAELAVLDAEIALDDAQDEFERAEDLYKRNRTAPGRAENYEQKQRQLALAEIDLAEAEDDLAEMIVGADPLEVEQKQKQLAVAQAQLKEAENDLVEMLSNVNSLVVAPFSGIVISVNAEEDEAVQANQVVIELADPDKFEAEILVNEMDISGIQVGARASIQVDAMGGISLPAEVTYISPTAVIQAGVVNYEVSVEIQSRESVMQEHQQARQEATQEISPGELPEQLKQAIKEGRITQEQAEEMIKQRQQGQEGWEGLMPAITAEDFQLREGLTVTVSVIIQERNDVLLVPNQAITRQGMVTFVQVLEDLEDEEGNPAIEQRLVQTGLSNWQYTEVIEGLTEGERVVIPQSSSATTTPEQGGRMPFFPGGGSH